MAARHERAAPGPYRASARPVEDAPIRRARLRWPVARALAAPLYVGVAMTAIASVVFGLLHASARERSLFLGPRTFAVEALAIAMLAATLPMIASALLRNCARFAAPRATKRRYVVRHLAIQAACVGVAIASIVLLRPPGTKLLASAMREDGREAFVYRWEWGCGYRLHVAEGPWMTRMVTAVGPLACDAGAPRVEWSGDAVRLAMHDGEVLGMWRAD